MWNLYRDLARHVQHMQPEEFFILTILAIAIGMICLRGFGSRSTY